MKVILVTGHEGFIGRNLCVALRREKFEVVGFDVGTPAEDLPELASRADLVFHLAGVNRPKDESDFTTGNTDLTRRLADALREAGRRTPIVMSSSIQAELDNPYGRSKLGAESVLAEYHVAAQAPVYVYRFPNVFGKWSRPSYNSVVATFCHNINRGLPVQLNNRESVIRFLYIDDIVREFLALARQTTHDNQFVSREVTPVYPITLGALSDLLVSFREGRDDKTIPDVGDPLTKYLLSTYLSFAEPRDFARPVELRTDDRGWLFEWVKSPHFGQVFVSSTRPGITRGNHYHDTKIEKFCVIRGEGVIRFRPISSEEIIEYPVSDRAIQVVDIPPGYTHSIQNTGDTEMITLFWANEVFDPQRPDTHAAKVDASPVTGPEPEKSGR